jgi:hypothetical protein
VLQEFFAKAEKKLVETAGWSGALDGFVVGSARVNSRKFKQRGALNIGQVLEKLQVGHSLLPQGQSTGEGSREVVIYVTRGVTSVMEIFGLAKIIEQASALATIV